MAVQVALQVRVAGRKVGRRVHAVSRSAAKLLEFKGYAVSVDAKPQARPVIDADGNDQTNAVTSAPEIVAFPGDPGNAPEKAEDATPAPVATPADTEPAAPKSPFE